MKKAKSSSPQAAKALEEAFVRVLETKGSKGRASLVTPFSLEPTERIQLEARASMSGFSKTALIKFALAACERTAWAGVPQVHVVLKALKLINPNGTLVDDIVDKDYEHMRITPRGRAVMLGASRRKLSGDIL